MKLWDDYIAYLKDNPEHYWFKRKLYGFGWTPATKEGWLALGVYLAFVLFVVFSAGPNIPESEVLNRVIKPVVVATILLLAITWRMGEPLKWQWGKKKSNQR